MAWVYSPEGISKSKDKINKNMDRYCEICYTKLYLTVHNLMEIAKETKLEPFKKYIVFGASSRSTAYGPRLLILLRDSGGHTEGIPI